MKISIVVPIYNSEDYLRKCVDSLVLQTYKDIEIILVNDGSTDSSYEICKEYKNTDNRIKIVDKQNGGLSDARNAGLDAASGDYIMFVDSDDYIKNTACHRFYDAISNKEVDIAAGNANRIDGENITLEMHSLRASDERISGKGFLKYELKHNTMNMASCFNLYRTSFLKENNIYFKKGIYHEDELFTPQAFLNAQNVISTDNVFYNYIIRENSITTKSDKTKNAEDVLSICKELTKIYDTLEDDELKAHLNNHIVNLYLNIFQVARLYKNKYKYLVDKKMLKGKGNTRINKIRILLFCSSPKVYYFANYIRKKIKTQ